MGPIILRQGTELCAIYDLKPSVEIFWLCGSSAGDAEDTGRGLHKCHSSLRYRSGREILYREENWGSSGSCVAAMISLTGTTQCPLSYKRKPREVVNVVLILIGNVLERD